MGDRPGHPFRGNQWVDALNEKLNAETQRIRDTLPGGSRLEAFVASAGDLYLDIIKIPKEYQGQGHGTKVLKALTAWADERGLSISLNPEADPGKKEKLRAFYRSFGFGPKSSRRFYDPTARGAWIRPAHKSDWAKNPPKMAS